MLRIRPVGCALHYTDTHTARQPNDRWCWTRTAHTRYVCYVAFLSFFPIPLFTAKGAYELISIANLRFWPGLSATPLRQWNANKYRVREERKGAGVANSKYQTKYKRWRRVNKANNTWQHKYRNGTEQKLKIYMERNVYRIYCFVADFLYIDSMKRVERGEEGEE